jgi:DNA-binding LacI/PurR family transcriptional regulator
MEDRKWFQQRAERLRKNALEFFPHMKIEVVEQYSFPSLPQNDGIDPAQLQHNNDSIMLQGILRNKRITAILAPNDIAAKGFYRALRTMGKRIPEDISLLSWDNRPDLMPYPISSVDFGLNDLAYRTVHFLLGMLPVHEGTSRYFHAHNSVAIRGSTAPIHPSNSR